MTRQNLNLNRHQTSTTSTLSSGLLQRKCACGQRTIAGGECEDCQKKRSSLQKRSVNQAEPAQVPPIGHEKLKLETETHNSCRKSSFGYALKQPQIQPILQTKLMVGQPGDRYEQEANFVAEQVMRMPDPTRPLPTSIQPLALDAEENLQRQIPEEEEEEEEEKILQAKGLPDQVPQVTPDIEARIQSMRGTGHPLPDSTRAFFEPRFGADFSQVRVHADSQAAETAQLVNAKAFTIGRDIVFGAGQYQPSVSEGRQLLAHELTHFIQQGGKRSTLDSSISTQDFLQCDPNNKNPQGSTATTSEKDLVQKLIDQGITNKNKLTNEVYWKRHPHLRGKRIDPKTKKGKRQEKEWNKILKNIVRPLLRELPVPVELEPLIPPSKFTIFKETLQELTKTKLLFKDASKEFPKLKYEWQGKKDILIDIGHEFWEKASEKDVKRLAEQAYEHWLTL